MSEADSSWYLRHRDGVEHGPFQLADLVTAAKSGNVASDTSVRHEVHTRGQWVVASRVQPIAQAMPSTEQPGDKSAPPDHPPAASNRVTANPDVGSDVALRHIREDAFPVPKNFLDAVGTLFVDIRFQRFVTPWIVEIVWAMTLAVAILSTVKLGYDMFIEPSMTAPDPKAVRGNWEFQPLGQTGHSGLLIRFLVFATWGTLTTLLVLCLRVAFELMIVFFRTSGDVAELRRLWKQSKS